jgi:hypothetical protein
VTTAQSKLAATIAAIRNGGAPNKRGKKKPQRVPVATTKKPTKTEAQQGAIGDYVDMQKLARELHYKLIDFDHCLVTCRTSPKVLARVRAMTLRAGKLCDELHRDYDLLKRAGLWKVACETWASNCLTPYDFHGGRQ